MQTNLESCSIALLQQGRWYYKRLSVPQFRLETVKCCVNRTRINASNFLQDEPLPKHAEPLAAEESKNTREIKDNSIAQDKDEASESSDSSSESDEDERLIRIKLPLQLDFDDLAGALMEKNQKSRMNCIVEKKRAEEVVDHQPKTVALPFGVNLTTDPRYERLSGERMAIFCESGNMQR